MARDSWVHARASRIRRLSGTRKVVTPEMIDTGLAEENPKEPTAVYHDGTVYLVCVSWDSHDGTVTRDKRPALFVSDRPDGGFEQVSLLADTPNTYEHAAAVTVHEGGLYVFYSVRRPEHPEAEGNDIHLKHAPVDDIPPTSEGWVDEGAVLENARDPGLWQLPDGTWRMFFSSEGWRFADPVERVGEFDNVGRVESEDLQEWTNRTDPVYTEANDQAPDIVPKRDGSGFWLVVTNTYGPDAVAGEADSLDDEFEGAVPLNESGYMNGEKKRWFSEQFTHFDYLKRGPCTDLHVHRNQVVAYFEGKPPGGPYSVGVAFAHEPDYPRLPYRESDLAAYYPAQAGAGTTLRETVRGADVTVSEAKWTESTVGSALSLSGTGIDIDPEPLPGGGDPFTVLCLARKTDREAKTTWLVWGDDERVGLESLADGDVRFLAGDTGVDGTPPAPYDHGSYHLLCGVYDPGAAESCRLYYDGALLAAGAGAPAPGDAGAHVGYNPFEEPTARAPDGDLAHLGVYDVALDAADVRNVYDKMLHG